MYFTFATGTSYEPTSAAYNPSQMPYNPLSTPDTSYQPQQHAPYNRPSDNNTDQAYNPSQPSFGARNNAFNPSRSTDSPFSVPLGNLVNPYPPPPPPPDEYNPEEELETWDPEPTWEQPPVELDTPESPPMYEKEGYGDPVEYHDGNEGLVFGTASDVDHRVLPAVLPANNSGEEPQNNFFANANNNTCRKT